MTANHCKVANKWLDYNNVQVSHLFKSVPFNELVCPKWVWTISWDPLQIKNHKYFSQSHNSLTDLIVVVIYGLKDVLMIFEETFIPTKAAFKLFSNLLYFKM